MKKIPISNFFKVGNTEFLKGIPVAWAAKHCPMAGVRFKFYNRI